MNNEFIDVATNKPIINIEEGKDYGLILKLHPEQFPKRTWLVCAGLGEYGTSGAAWYLAYKWNEIYGYAKDKPFAIIVEVKRRQDEYAKPVIKALGTCQ